MGERALLVQEIPELRDVHGAGLDDAGVVARLLESRGQASLGAHMNHMQSEIGQLRCAVVDGVVLTLRDWWEILRCAGFCLLSMASGAQ